MIEKFFCRVFISLQPCETEGEEERLGGGKRIYIYICTYSIHSLRLLVFRAPVFLFIRAVCYVAVGMLLKYDEHGGNGPFFLSLNFFHPRGSNIVTIVLVIFRVDNRYLERD